MRRRLTGNRCTVSYYHFDKIPEIVITYHIVSEKLQNNVNPSKAKSKEDECVKVLDEHAVRS